MDDEDIDMDEEVTSDYQRFTSYKPAVKKEPETKAEAKEETKAETKPEDEGPYALYSIWIQPSSGTMGQ